MDERYIASVDLGSSGIVLTIARVYGDDVQVIWHRAKASSGIRNSYIFNPMMVEKPMKELLSEAEAELRLSIKQVVVNMPRYFVNVETATAKAERDADSCISQEEIDNLKSIALETYPLQDKAKQVIYGAVAQSFSADDEMQLIESDVVGMMSPYLDGHFKVFVGARRNINNIYKLFNDLDISVAELYFTPDNTAKAVLTNEEMDNGVALIDLGAGVTSVSVYKNKILRHYGAIPFGGKSITGDIHSESNWPDDLCENVKKAYGILMPDRLLSMSEKVIQLNDENSATTSQLPVKYLSEVITSRMDEIIDAILYEIEESGFADDLRSGVVITGGGANITNCSAFITEKSGYSVRMGYPRHLFSASGCPGVGETDATTSIGMILAAKNDNRGLNCAISEGEEEVVEEPAEEVKPVDVFFEEVVEEPEEISAAEEEVVEEPEDPYYEQPEEEKDEPEVKEKEEELPTSVKSWIFGLHKAPKAKEPKPEKPEKPKPEKPEKPKGPSKLSFVWGKISNGLTNFVDNISDDESESV